MFAHFRNVSCIFCNIDCKDIDSDIKCNVCTIKPHYCNKCDKFNAHLNIHCNKKHGATTYECEICGAKNHHNKEICPYKKVYEHVKQNNLTNAYFQIEKSLDNISILIPVYQHQNNKYVACHFEYKKTDFNSNTTSLLLQSAGGFCDNEKYNTTDDMLDAAIMFGYKQDGICNISRNSVKSIETIKHNAYCFYYFTVDVNLTNFNINDDVLCCITKNPKVTELINKFPKNSCISTKVDSTFLINIDILKNTEYNDIVYKPFRQFLIKFF